MAAHPAKAEAVPPAAALAKPNPPAVPAMTAAAAPTGCCVDRENAGAVAGEPAAGWKPAKPNGLGTAEAPRAPLPAPAPAPAAPVATAAAPVVAAAAAEVANDGDDEGSAPKPPGFALAANNPPGLLTPKADAGALPNSPPPGKLPSSPPLVVASLLLAVLAAPKRLPVAAPLLLNPKPLLLLNPKLLLLLKAPNPLAKPPATDLLLVGVKAVASGERVVPLTDREAEEEAREGGARALLRDGPLVAVVEAGAEAETEVAEGAVTGAANSALAAEGARAAAGAGVCCVVVAPGTAPFPSAFRWASGEAVREPDRRSNTLRRSALLTGFTGVCTSPSSSSCSSSSSSPSSSPSSPPGCCLAGVRGSGAGEGTAEMAFTGGASGRASSLWRGRGRTATAETNVGRDASAKHRKNAMVSAPSTLIAHFCSRVYTCPLLTT